MSAARETGRGTRLRALKPDARAVRARYIADAGHGWFAVPRRPLPEYGVEREISRFSYVSRAARVVYLEHDVDIACFAGALERSNAVLVVRSEYIVPRALCSVRHRSRYRPSGTPLRRGARTLRDAMARRFRHHRSPEQDASRARPRPAASAIR